MEANADHHFPEGIRVLVVNDDPLDLKVVREMLISCNFKVTTCGNPRSALTLLRERRSDFDLLLADVYMQEFSGFELLTIVKDELDLPTIMMSNDRRLETMKICHELGACFFMLKPLDVDIAKNLWQHIICNTPSQRAKFESEIGESSLEKTPHAIAILNDKFEGKRSLKGKNVRTTNTTSRRDSPNLKNIANMGILKSGGGGKGKGREQITRKEHENCRKGRKPRVWGEYLEGRFRFSVRTLGKDAVPSTIVKHMNVEGITRAQVASHLQKHRLKQKNEFFVPSIPIMLKPGTEMAQFKQVSNQYGLLTTQGFLNSFSLKHPVAVNQTVPFGLQLPPNFNNYPNLSSIQSRNDNFLLHQNASASQNQLASNFGMTGEMPVLHSTSSLATNRNNFTGFGGGIPHSFEAAVQTQQLNTDIQFSSSFGASTKTQQFNCGIQVSESCREIHQRRQLQNDMAQISDSDGNFPYMISGYSDIGLLGNDSNDIDTIQCNASKQHTHLVSTNTMTNDASYVDAAATSANQFSITDPEQQHNTSEEKTHLVSENTRNDATLDRAVISADQSVNNFEKQYAGSHVAENSSKVVEEENLNHMTENFACGDDIWPLMLVDSFNLDFI